jgi:glutathione synthase/RimK-type ligase-like ATP-grasp enzyme
MVDSGGGRVALDDVTGVYTRLTSWAELPEVAAGPALLERVRDIHEALEAWLETTRARVINRTSANDTNNSKPYQAMIIRDYFDVPATLVTNDAEALAEFRREFGRIVYKSTSGERSIVTTFTAQDVQRLHLLASVPVQFQEHVKGVDVRVHVVGPEVFACSIESDAVDYRYDPGGPARMNAVELPDDVAARCVALTARLGLELAGVDLRFADDGRIVCFEVNPSPAYTAFSEVTGHPIAAAIARRLAAPTTAPESYSYKRPARG